MKKLIILCALFAAGCSTMAPSKTECKVHKEINQPATAFAIVGGMVSGVIAPGLGSLTLAGSAARDSACPKPRLITHEEAQKMIADAFEQRGQKYVQTQ